jgi:arylsulfatase A-like enzyme
MRANFMFRTTIVLILLAHAHVMLAASDRPNIVLIFADDLGWKDVGYNGSDYFETPNIDRFKTQSMSFNYAYAGGGNCQPSRACLMSGQYTPRHGVYAVGSTDRGPEKLMRMIPVPNTPYLESANVTMAEALKAGGYATAHFGKWHLESRQHPGTTPEAQGFDLSIAGSNGKKGPEDPKGIFSTTADVCKFMKENRDRPFFAYVAHHAIHSPLQARPATLEKFKAKPPGKQHDNPLYAACTYDFDDGVGVLLKCLAELGLEQNTLVVLTSDNGATQQSSQEPLRGNKGCYYEGGVREPFLVRWPGVTTAGSSCETPVINLDLYPTFLAAAHVAAPKDKTLDGEDLVPLFRGGSKLKRQSIYWHFPGYLDNAVIRGRDPVFRTRPVSAVHRGDWKLLLYHEEWQLDGGRAKVDTNHAVELYNLASDGGERVDVANSNTAKRDELLDDLLGWFKAVDAKLPTEKNPKYESGSKAGAGKKKNKKNAASTPE